MPRVLVVDDEKLIVKGIRFSLEQDGMEVDCAYDGIEAIEKAKEKEYDVVLLDVMLPDHDGFEVCQAIREFSEMPIIMLTAKGGDMDKILGLEYGADDYITKPFNILELKARVRALLRRAGSGRKETRSNLLSCGNISLDADARNAYNDGVLMDLTAKEFDLVELLMRNPNRVYSREALLDTIWGYEYRSDIRTVDVHIRRLREKLERNPAEPEHILTKWGVGYYFKA